MNRHTRSVRQDILKALDEAGQPCGAARILEQLAGSAGGLQERSIRLHLARLDREGLTRLVSRRRGRELTERGRAELARADVLAKVGFVAARMDSLSYRMSYSLPPGEGTLITNFSLLPKSQLARALEDMRPVFARGLATGARLIVAREGQSLGGLGIPRDMVGLGTVCSLSVNGMLLKQGIPVFSRFGGLLEIREGQPVRFVELLDYQGTTADPLELFIRANMTRVRAAARGGSGIVGASFREIPAAALEPTRQLHRRMRQAGLAGILALGRPGQPVFDIPVPEGRAGLVVVGGLNPIAAVRENGAQISVQSLAGLEDAVRFHAFEALRDRLPEPL